MLTSALQAAPASTSRVEAIAAVDPVRLTSSAPSKSTSPGVCGKPPYPFTASHRPSADRIRAGPAGRDASAPVSSGVNRTLIETGVSATSARPGVDQIGGAELSG